MGEIRVKTADEWQTLPSHEKTSNGWKDIPTHTMTATGWQGELTSQSPLEFRATGQSLLDWRVDGKTSKNLFDLNRLPSDTWTTDMRYYMNGGIVTSKTVDPMAVTISVNNDTLSVTTVGGNGAGFLVEVKPSAKYRLVFTKSESLDSNKTSCTYALVDTSETIGQLQAIYGDADGVVFATDSNTKYVYFVFRKAAGTISYSNIMLNEGDTALPYEPYGGVGDWDEAAQKYKIPVTVNGTTTNLYTDAQLMDGDSLDFATDQTTIPITQGDNTLTVLTQVQPSKVYVKFEG